VRLFVCLAGVQARAFTELSKEPCLVSVQQQAEQRQKPGCWLTGFSH
jgi:hypothetical protein